MTCKPRPAIYDLLRRKPYHAGYSDGYLGYRFGSGDLEPGNDYRRGFTDGQLDVASGRISETATLDGTKRPRQA